MSEEPKMIKMVLEIGCPHCSKKIMVSLRSYAPSIDWALKEVDLTDAKQKLKEEVEAMKFEDPKRKEEILSLIEQKDFILGPEEITPIASQILKDNVKS